MCRKRHNINNPFELAGVYYPSRQIYILTKTVNNIFMFSYKLTKKMEISLTDRKKQTFKVCCSELLHKNNEAIGYVAK